MSEYQYYEFVALDRPLTKADMEELRGVSSRADISSTRFVNVYNYGDFRGDPYHFMTRYFDAMIYVANWGTHRLMLRLPADLVDRTLWQTYCPGESASLRIKENAVVVDFCSQLEEFADWEEGEGWLSPLVPLRAELLNGDLRALYLGWLLCVQCEEVDEASLEPPVPPGLNNLSGALECLVEYLRIDPDLVAVAAEKSTAQTGLSVGLEDWIAALPAAEKNALLLALVKGEDPQIGARLLRRYRASTGVETGTTSTERRTVGELLEAMDRRRQAREQAEIRQQAEKRARYLDELAQREEAVWHHVEQQVTSKQAKAYAEAVRLLKDLKELNLHKEKISVFEKRCSDLCHRHQKKKTFIERMKQAGLH